MRVFIFHIIKKTALSIGLLSLPLFFYPSLGECLDGDDIIALRRCGISDATIQAMVREKTKETCAFTVQEIIDMKRAGLSDKTIQMLVIDGSFMKDTEPIVYGKEFSTMEFTTANDVIALKHAGVSDKIIQAIIIFGSRVGDDTEGQKAADFLKDMGLILDMGKKHKYRPAPGRKRRRRLTDMGNSLETPPEGK